MLEKKTQNFNMIIYSLIFVVLVTMLIGTSYAYFTKKIQNGDETNVVIKSASMFLRYYQSNQINDELIKPGWENKLNFSIENYSTDVDGKYKIKLEIIRPLINKIDENFVYELNGSTSKDNETEKVVTKEETPVPVETTEIGTGIISPETLHSYELTIKLKDNGQDQNYLKDKLFIAKLTVENDYE